MTCLKDYGYKAGISVKCGNQYSRSASRKHQTGSNIIFIWTG